MECNNKKFSADCELFVGGICQASRTCGSDLAEQERRANAYPKLVEALKKSLKAMEAGGELQMAFIYGDAEDLLKELGEL